MKAKYIVFGIGFFLVGVISAPQARADALRIIVNSQNRTKELSRKFLADAFLKKITFWEQGDLIVPVDQDSESDTRKDFSEEILKKPVAAVRSYWQQMIFSGQSIPPVEFDTEEQVVRYVGSHANAVAYVSNKVALGSKVKIITLK